MVGAVVEFGQVADEVADLATADGAALHGAEEHELDDEEGLQDGSVVGESLQIFWRRGGCSWVGDEGNQFALSTCSAKLTASAYGCEDGASEEGRTQADYAAVGGEDEVGRGTGDHNAAEHEDGKDEEDQVDDGVVLVSDSPASRRLLDLFGLGPVRGLESALVIPVMNLSLSCIGKHGYSRHDIVDNIVVVNKIACISYVVANRVSKGNNSVHSTIGVVELIVLRGDSGKAEVGQHDAKLDGHGHDEADDWADLAVAVGHLLNIIHVRSVFKI